MNHAIDFICLTTGANMCELLNFTKPETLQDFFESIKYDPIMNMLFCYSPEGFRVPYVCKELNYEILVNFLKDVE